MTYIASRNGIPATSITFPSDLRAADATRRTFQATRKLERRVDARNIDHAKPRNRTTLSRSTTRTLPRGRRSACRPSSDVSGVAVPFIVVVAAIIVAAADLVAHSPRANSVAWHG